jgi:hypothetical protein
MVEALVLEFRCQNLLFRYALKIKQSCVAKVSINKKGVDLFLKCRRLTGLASRVGPKRIRTNGFFVLFFFFFR